MFDLRKRVEAIEARRTPSTDYVDSIFEIIHRKIDDRHAQVQALTKRIADLEAFNSLLLGFLNAHVIDVPEVPAVPAEPARKEIQKVKK